MKSCQLCSLSSFNGQCSNIILLVQKSYFKLKKNKNLQAIQIVDREGNKFSGVNFFNSITAYKQEVLIFFRKTSKSSQKQQD